LISHKGQFKMAINS